MHVHTLEFAAIGPFAGRHRIDFDGLGGASLFLIDGPTGAGKTTIIDALVFALFGDVAGRTSDRQRLRSAFAAPDVETFAEVEFSTSFGRYRVRRTPEYERTKRKGTGTTTSASTVALFRSTGEHGWEPVSQHKGEADAEIQRAIGLTRAQFLQTVVLPQGEFATFLAADSKDRQAVLERIFATDLYSRIEDALDAQRIEAQREREAVDKAVTAAVRHVVSRLSDSDLGEGEAMLADVRDPEAALALVARIEDEATARLADVAIVADVAAQTLAKACAAKADAEARASAVAELEQARARLGAARGAVVHAEQQVATHSALLATVPGADGDVVAAIDRLMGSLDHAAKTESALPVERERLVAATRHLAELDEQSQALERERDVSLPARLLALSVALRNSVDEADARVAEAEAAEARLVQARLDGMAGELADGLVSGQPCPVCGSLEHPTPAHQQGPEVTLGDLDGARTRRTSAEAARQAWLAEGARLSALADVPDFDGGVGVNADDTAIDDVVAGIRQFQRDSERLTGTLSRIREQRASAETTLEAQTDVVAGMEAALAKARGGYRTVAERLADLRAARGIVLARDDVQRAATRAADAVVDAESRLSAWPPDLPSEDLDELAEQCRSLEKQMLEAVSARDTTAGLVEDLRHRAEAARGAVERRDGTWRTTHDVITLANLMRGGDGNVLAQPLSAYVVQRMFDEILEAANRRLQVMLDGRFSLQSTERRTGSARLGQGLGLEVVDQRTDSVRKAATLSGGETFCASLALALGLADTVRSHSGGVELGMLFIDEGFGSLDGDRLDEVMAELLRLRADGRTVGVISHVSEMKKGISERIDVTSLGARQGSTLSVSWDS